MTKIYYIVYSHTIVSVISIYLFIINYYNDTDNRELSMINDDSTILKRPKITTLKKYLKRQKSRSKTGINNLKRSKRNDSFLTDQVDSIY